MENTGSVPVLKEVTLSGLRETTKSQKYCVSGLISHIRKTCSWSPKNDIRTAEPSGTDTGLHDPVLMGPAF